MNAGPVRSAEGGVSLTIRVTPRASRNEVAGVEQGELRIKLRAPPVEGAANAALIEFVAEWLGVRQGAVSIASGDRSRHKVVHVTGLTVEIVQKKLGQA
jgi:uncharacterized protein (TIGR00251 family)